MSLPSSFFVTGTDTEVGKSLISVGIMQVLQQQGLKTVGMKPVASGCEIIDGSYKNADAIALINQSDVCLPYELVNPYAFEPAIAPHLAALQSDVIISTTHIKQCYQQLQQTAEAIVVEGAGGWLVPINASETIADIATQLDLPVILVVDIRLGCINHALLTAAAIQQSGSSLFGWVANRRRNVVEADEIIDAIVQRINVPMLGNVPCLTDNSQVSHYLQLSNQLTGNRTGSSP